MNFNDSRIDSTHVNFDDDDDCCGHDHTHSISFSKSPNHNHGDFHDHTHAMENNHCDTNILVECLATVSFEHDHGHAHINNIHDHGHAHVSHDNHRGGCCGLNNNIKKGEDCFGQEDHGHAHVDHGNHGGCCGLNNAIMEEEDCCRQDRGHSNKASTANNKIGDNDCCGHDHDDVHSNTASPHGDHSHGDHTHSGNGNKNCCADEHDHISNMNDSAEIAITVQTSVHVCDACDPSSLLPHASVVTRLRIANLCCAGEERIIRTSLEGLHGVESVAVNIIGRYAIIKHCPVDCCAPTSNIVDILNDQRLGASIQEANEESKGDYEGPVDFFKGFHVFILFVLLITGIICGNIDGQYQAADIVFIIGTSLGVLPIAYDAYISIMRRTLDIHVLMLIAIIGALASAEYFDACLVVALFLSAEFFEDTIMRRVRKAVKVSVGGTVKTATLVSGKSIPVKDLKIGDIFSVRAGEMICADGVVSRGDGVVNESALTGESLPVSKVKGSKVMSGTIVQNGYIEVEVAVDAKDSTMQRLQETIQDMQADRGHYAQLVDEFAKYWTPVVLITAFILVVAGGAATNDWAEYTNKGLILLVLTCPCAIVIAAPIPSVCTIAIASKHGVLIKGSTIIEKLGVVDSVSIDKTGTLTKGYFKVVSQLSLSTSKEDGYYDPLRLAAAMEIKSTHPLANAVVSEYCGCIAEMEGDLNDVKKVKVIEGVGISGWVEVDKDWKFVIVGNERLLDFNGGKVSTTSNSKQEIQNFCEANASSCILIVAVEDELELILALADELREEAREFVLRSSVQGLSVTMLTGDHENVALDIAGKVDIKADDCKSRLLPSDKLMWIKNAQEIRGKKVMMIGDGINDATALTLSHVGVAMGNGGAAMAVEAADVVIMSDNLLRISSTVSLCRASTQIIIHNCVFAIGIKIVAVILASLGLLTFWQAVLIDLGSLVVVIVNGTRPLMSNFYRNSNLDTVQQLKSSIGEEVEWGVQPVS